MKHRPVRKTVVWLSISAAVVLLAATVRAVFVNEEPHRFSDSECFGCHFTLPEPGGQEPHSFTDEITVLCTGCHEVSPLSHVVDIVPFIPVPANMPLSERGTITCGTCHDPHTKYEDPLTGERTYFLRAGKPGKGFCLICHEDPLVPGEPAIFSYGGGVTHRRSMDKSHGFARFDVVDPFTEVDPLTSICIGCHDASEDEPDRSLPGLGIWDHGGGIGRSHPLGNNYEDAAWKDDELVRTWDLDKRILFFDGKIGCCSCHDMYAPGGSVALTVGTPDDYLDLCLACHIK